MPEPLKPLEFELRFHRGAYDIDPDTKLWIFMDERDKSLPDEPEGWPQQKVRRGDHPTIYAIAERLNQMQMKSGFINYFFFPEIPDKVVS